ncbi:hypothetical protein [Shinella zoogloeoides]
MLVRFQPWLVAGGVFLNLIASGGAAVSAWFSWKQTGVAIDAVNITSRNQAFSDYLAAWTDVCRVSLIPQDQDDFWTANGSPDSYDPPRTDLFEIRGLYESQIEPRTKEQVDSFLAEGNKKREAMWEKWTQLQIWIDEQMAEDLSQWGPDYSRDYLEDDKLPAAYYAVEQQRRCRVLLSSASDLYKNPNDQSAKSRQTTDIWVIPLAEEKTTEAMLKEWGREDIIATLIERKLWPLPQ